MKNNIAKKMLAAFALVILAGTLAVSVPVRVYQLIHDIDFSSGFFISRGGAYNNLLVSVVAASIVLFIVTIILVSQKKEQLATAPRYKAGNYVWCGILCAAGTASLVNVGIRVREGATTLAEWILVSLLILNIFALAYLAYSACKKKAPGAADAFYLVPTAYTAMLLITKFLAFTSILTISEHSLDVLSLSSLILFLLFRFSYTRESVKITKFKTKILSEIFAFAGTVLGAVAYIPRIIVFFIGSPAAKEYIVLPTIWELAVLCFALYCALTAAFSSITRSKNDNRAA